MAEPEATHESAAHAGIHLPPPSIWPAVLALGIAMVLLGLVLNLVLLAIGVVVTIAAIASWVRDARREFSELPE